jgi:hypothetical protein
MKDSDEHEHSLINLKSLQLASQISTMTQNHDRRIRFIIFLSVVLLATMVIVGRLSDFINPTDDMVRTHTFLTREYLHIRP